MSKKQIYNLKIMVDNMRIQIMNSIIFSLTPLIDFISVSVRSSGLSDSEIITYNNGMQIIADLINNGISNGYFSTSGLDNIVQLNTVISCDSDTTVNYIVFYTLNADKFLFTFIKDDVSGIIKLIPTTPFYINNLPTIDFLTTFHKFYDDCKNVQ